MEHALIVSPHVWVVESLHAVVVPGIKFVVCARHWKRWRKEPFNIPLPVPYIPARSWHEAQHGTSGKHSVRDCNGNFVMSLRKLKLMLDIKMNYGWRVENSSNGVAGFAYFTCKVINWNLESSVPMFGFRVPQRGTLVRVTWSKEISTRPTSVSYRDRHPFVVRYQSCT